MKQPSVAVCSNHTWSNSRTVTWLTKRTKKTGAKHQWKVTSFLCKLLLYAREKEWQINLPFLYLSAFYSSRTPVVSNSSQYFMVFGGFCFKEAGWELQRESPWHLLSVTHGGVLWSRLSDFTILVLYLVCLCWSSLPKHSAQSRSLPDL